MRAIIFFACFVLVHGNIDKKRRAPSTITEGGSIKLIVPENEPINLSCSFKENPGETYEWRKINNGEELNVTAKGNVEKIESHVFMNFPIKNVTRKDIGTYQCIAVDGPGNRNRIGSTNLNVVAPPDVMMNVGNVTQPAGNVLLSWTIANKNDNSETYVIEYAMQNGTSLYSENIQNGESEYETERLEFGIGYHFRIWVLNGTNQIRVSPYSTWVRNTEKKETEFIPAISVVNKTKTSITYRWRGPPEELEDKVNSYRMNASNGFSQPIATGLRNEDVDYTLRNLSCSTEYSIQIQACAQDPDECMKSSEIHDRTLDCTNNSAADFYPQINTILAIMFALYLSTYA